MSREIVVFSTPLCAPCEALKGYLRARGIDFVTRDLLMDEEAAALLESRSIFGAPALGIDGEIYAGRDLERDTLDRLLGLAGPGEAAAGQKETEQAT